MHEYHLLTNSSDVLMSGDPLVTSNKPGGPHPTMIEFAVDRGFDTVVQKFT